MAVLAHLLAGLHPRHELLVVHAFEVGTLHAVYDAPGALLLGFVECGQFTFLHFLLRIEVGSETTLGHDGCHWLAIVGVVGLHGHVVNLRSYAERHVRRQCPRCRRPCQEVSLAVVGPCLLRVNDLELCRNSGVFHVTVATRLIELVRAQTGTGGGRVRLNGVAFVEQSLVVELLEQPPQRFNVFVVVGDIGMVQVDKVSHLFRQAAPLCGELHDVLTTAAVIVLRGDILV